MTLTLYDMRAADPDVRPSPYCWLVKFALLHKGLDFETVPLGFSEKQNYPDPDYGKLPVIDDDGELVRDSAVILDHLDRNYPDCPLAGTPRERGAAAFYKAWAQTSIFPALGPLIIKPLFAAVSADDQVYMRATFESRLGKTIEEYADTPGAAEKLQTALALLASPLAACDFLGGEKPNLCDYIVFSPFMWARGARRAPVFETPAPVGAWAERMLDLFDGYGRKAKSAA